MINYNKINNLISYLKKYQLIFSCLILLVFPNILLDENEIKLNWYERLMDMIIEN